MSDISIHISPLDWLIAAPVFGWPGLLLGGVLGALAWRRRPILGGALGAVLGCVFWFGASMMLKLVR